MTFKKGELVVGRTALKSSPVVLLDVSIRLQIFHNLLFMLDINNFNIGLECVDLL